jgi:hypothetical protein
MKSQKFSFARPILIFFLGSDALRIGVAIIFCMHASGVKHMQRVIESAIKTYCFF